MNNKTLETIQKTIVRFETILELDNSLTPRDVYCIQVILTNLSYMTPYENTHEDYTEKIMDKV